MGALWYGSVVSLEQLQQLVHEIDVAPDLQLLALQVMSATTATLQVGLSTSFRHEVVASPLTTVYGLQSSAGFVVQSDKDVAAVVTEILTDQEVSVATCGTHCRRHRHNIFSYILGVEQGSIDSRDEAIVPVDIPSSADQARVDAFCTRYNLPQAQFYFNGNTECYVCSH